MSYAPNRSKHESLIKGTTEGKYWYARPDTEDPSGSNTAATLADRSTLQMWNGFNLQEAPRKDSPGE
jgi:hypothetical protein